MSLRTHDARDDRQSGGAGGQKKEFTAGKFTTDLPVILPTKFELVINL